MLLLLNTLLRKFMKLCATIFCPTGIVTIVPTIQDGAHGVNDWHPPMKSLRHMS